MKWKRRGLEYLTKVSGCDKDFALLIGRLIKSREVYSSYLLISKMHNQTVLFGIAFHNLSEYFMENYLSLCELSGWE